MIREIFKQGPIDTNELVDLAYKDDPDFTEDDKERIKNITREFLIPGDKVTIGFNQEY